VLVFYPGGIVLDVEPVTWLEVREHVPRGVVSGYMHHTLANVRLDPNHPDKARLRSAAALVRQVQPFPAVQLALGDFYTSRREIGPYSSFYAFRVLEDVGFHFGVTGEINRIERDERCSEQRSKVAKDDAGTADAT
jgi:hypothetical protein